MVSNRKIFSMCFPIKAYVKYVTSGAGLFLAQVYNLNKQGKGSPGDVTYKISRPKALCFRQEDFFMVLPIFGPCGIIRGPQGNAIY